ncbi:haloacid dehalogenase superfamily, subfamily IA, variant 3 with third motif having DD or ED [Friedmanniella luteola]|uniref:Haloacid dehalogenase superfamily, subfamily IA, variant 3 with third motif having DD or ED n=1 Tax=Friedmanniella luteola TaxID=546871 RepID=A0A1H1U806_9ACTN|nr:HAD family phosphatase [Friedmanniella luteola]SDS68610.1 haloacid dehalogenase superfamily, subfamily IA, variant 3 with third motif having DD or ED [Friedmanniella luteola]
MSTPTPAAPAAVLWDFDGTLADTEPLWIEAEFELIATLGGTWSEEQADELVGNSLIDSALYILNAIDRRDVDPAWVVDQLLGRVVGFLAERPMPWRPGALELLTALGGAGVPCGLVSASYRVLLDAALSQLPAGTFAVSVAGDEVTQGKPHPEPYEKACAALGVEARHCVVIEDSITGARSGNAAGCLVLAVPNRVEVPPAPRRRIVPSLTELDAAGVAELLEHADDPA